MAECTVLANGFDGGSSTAEVIAANRDADWSESSRWMDGEVDLEDGGGSSEGGSNDG